MVASWKGSECENLTTQLEQGLRRSPEPSRQVDNKQNQKQFKHSTRSKTPQLKQETDQRGCTHTHTKTSELSFSDFFELTLLLLEQENTAKIQSRPKTDYQRSSKMNSSLKNSQRLFLLPKPHVAKRHKS